MVENIGGQQPIHHTLALYTCTSVHVNANAPPSIKMMLNESYTTTKQMAAVGWKCKEWKKNKIHEKSTSRWNDCCGGEKKQKMRSSRRDYQQVKLHYEHTTTNCALCLLYSAMWCMPKKLGQIKTVTRWIFVSFIKLLDTLLSSVVSMYAVKKKTYKKMTLPLLSLFNFYLIVYSKCLFQSLPLFGALWKLNWIKMKWQNPESEGKEERGRDINAWNLSTFFFLLFNSQPSHHTLAKISHTYTQTHT